VEGMIIAKNGKACKKTQRDILVNKLVQETKIEPEREGRILGFTINETDVKTQSSSSSRR
jgi:hypothetical protein